MEATIKSIIENNLIFVSAQSDTTYFHWQAKIYLYNFSKYNIQDNCYCIFGIRDNKPSKEIIELSK
jgi:hypothetical protein